VKNELCERLGIEFPIFAFSHCRDVVAAVSRAGGLGVLGAVAFSPEQLELELAWIDEHVDGKPYGLDTVMPAKYIGREEGQMAEGDLQKMIPEAHRKWLAGLLEKYDIPELPSDADRHAELLGWSTAAGSAHVDVGLKHPIRLIANALGPPPAEIIERAHEAGVLVAALCGSVRQALKQKEAGVDIIIASGYEAGGHTGEITTMVLVPQVVDAVGDTPVLAAGGIGDGRQVAASLALGAQGVWTGSIWLATNESDTSEPVIEKMIAATSADTARHRCISGKPARQLVTEYTKAWDAEDCPGTLPMPLQGLLTMAASERIYRFADKGHPGAAKLVGTPVGQVVGQMNARKPAAKVVYDLVEGYLETVSKLQETLPED
jgi:NAD(P)H-dependent flavin oxidoreductase YrpB (nitropropane dioxygenase family)